jgi:NAD(P)-dependent dehydrogenase (short-subunit alcohol dehydrogenase family)
MLGMLHTTREVVMGFSVAGKHVLVTGASTGIGAALAIGLAEAGAVVGICARRETELGEVLERVREHSPASQMWTIDLDDLDALEPFAAEVSMAMDGLDVLVNNAGIPKRKNVLALDADIVESVMRINYFSPVRLMLAFLPELIERCGRIVNISSVAARLGPPGEAAYTASKAALTGFSESMHVDLGIAGHDVLVHLVNPGVIDTRLFHLPDNDPSLANIEALPTTAMVEPVLRALNAGTFEIYVPEWFGDIVGGKFPDTGAFLDGTIAWARDQVGSPS